MFLTSPDFQGIFSASHCCKSWLAMAVYSQIQQSMVWHLLDVCAPWTGVRDLKWLALNKQRFVSWMLTSEAVVRWDPCSGGWVEAGDGECPFLSHMERKGTSAEQRKCVMGRAGKKGSPDPRSTGRPNPTLMRRYADGVEVQTTAECASGALLWSSWDPELNSLRVSLGFGSMPH